MRQFMAITKALADENRVRVLVFLRQGELCACQIIELLRLSPSTVSKHLSILERAGLLQRRKAGRWAYFRLARPSAPALVRNALRWVIRSLRMDRQIAQDGRRLKAILKIDPDELCARHRRS